jgi:uncharacterized protein (DUF1501 family)
MDRRNFLLTTGAMGGMLTQGNVSFAQDTKDKDKNAVIYVFLGGGATHIETFNPIPLAPSNYRSVTGTARTNITGMTNCTLVNICTSSKTITIKGGIFITTYYVPKCHNITS